MPSIVNVKSNSGATANIGIAAMAVTAGDKILVSQVEYNNAVGAVPTDTMGNTYVQLGTTQYQGVAGLALYLATAIATGSTTITCHPNAAFTACVAWVINSAVYNNDWLSAKGTAVTIAVGPTAVPPAGSLMIAFANIAGNVNLGEQAGWNTTGVNGFTAGMSTAAKVNDWNANNDCFSMYKVTSSAETPTWPTGGGGLSWVAMVVSFGVPTPAPVSVSPAIGASTGGTPVTITGTNFTGTTGVTFGGVAATSVVASSDTTITCVAPAHAVGTAVITVTSPGGSGSLLASQWTYAVQPVPRTVSPQFSFIAGGSTMTIGGSGFQNGCTVTIDGTPATGVVFIDANHITCNIPAHAAGQVVITVTNP